LQVERVPPRQILVLCFNHSAAVSLRKRHPSSAERPGRTGPDTGPRCGSPISVGTGRGRPGKTSTSADHPRCREAYQGETEISGSNPTVRTSCWGLHIL
jgi:hypothetical protein